MDLPARSDRPALAGRASGLVPGFTENFMVKPLPVISTEGRDLSRSFPRSRDCERIRFSRKWWDEATIFHTKFCLMWDLREVFSLVPTCRVGTRKLRAAECLGNSQPLLHGPDVLDFHEDSAQLRTHPSTATLNYGRWLFMDSGLLWSAPAKRRGCIEPQSRGIPAALAGNPGTEVPPAPRRRRFPLAATALLGTDTSPNPKRRQDGATWPPPHLCLAL